MTEGEPETSSFHDPGFPLVKIGFPSYLFHSNWLIPSSVDIMEDKPITKVKISFALAFMLILPFVKLI